MVGEMDFPAGNFGTVPAGVILLDSQHRIFAMMHGTRGKKKKKKKKKRKGKGKRNENDCDCNHFHWIWCRNFLGAMSGTWDEFGNKTCAMRCTCFGFGDDLHACAHVNVNHHQTR